MWLSTSSICFCRMPIKRSIHTATIILWNLTFFFAESYSSTATEVAQAAHGLAAGSAMFQGISTVVGGGTAHISAKVFKTMANIAPFLGSLGSVLSIFGLFFDSPEVQRLDRLLNVVHEGFLLMETRFDGLDKKLKGIENTLNEQHFYTRIGL